MTGCGSGEVWRNGHCRPDGVTSVYALAVALLLGLGVLALGLYLRRRGKRPTRPAPPARGTVWREPRLAEKAIAKAAPYFLIVWGCLWTAGVAVALASR